MSIRQLAALIFVISCSNPSSTSIELDECESPVRRMTRDVRFSDPRGRDNIAATCAAVGSEGVACLEPRDLRVPNSTQLVLAVSCLAAARTAQMRTRGEDREVLADLQAGRLAMEDDGQVPLANTIGVRASRRPDGRIWLFLPTSLNPFGDTGVVIGSSAFQPLDFTQRSGHAELSHVPFPSQVVERLDARSLRVDEPSFAED
ncbi:MAG: hypothetical protein AAF938_10225 [Myxococcota bacterium]